MKKSASEIVMKGMDKIKPYENNPRMNENAVEYVANSIASFGFQNPIILDKKGVIICGHTRYKAAQRLGMAEVPCIVADKLTPAEVKAFRLADNRVSELAEWDDAKMRVELGELMKLPDISLTPLGMGDSFTRLFDSVKPVNVSEPAPAVSYDDDGGFPDESEVPSDDAPRVNPHDSWNRVRGEEPELPAAPMGKICTCPRCGMTFELKSGGEEE